MTDLKQFVYSSLSAEFVLRSLRARSARAGVAVLAYHEIAEDAADIEAWTVIRKSDFLRQLEYLDRYYDIVSLDDALDRLARPDTAPGRPLAVITFDDGDRGNADILLPIVQQQRVPVLVYVATGQVVERRSYWFDRLINALQVHQTVVVDLSAYGLDRYTVNGIRGPQNWNESERMLEALKSLDPDVRANAVESVLTKLPPPASRRENSQIEPMRIDDVKALAACSYVTIGSHSDCHNLLTQLRPEAVEDSVGKSKALLEDWTGKKIEHFAYPNGSYNRSTIDIVRRAGFRSAVTFEPRLWHKGDSPYRIPRVGVGRYDSLEKFKVNLLRGLHKFPWPREPTVREDVAVERPNAVADSRLPTRVKPAHVRSDPKDAKQRSATVSSAAQQEYRVRIATLDEFRSSREIWNERVFAMAQPSVFLTWEWIYTWWEHFAERRRDLVLLYVEQDGKLKGILPLFREQSAGSLGGASLRFCAADDLHPDHLDIIAAPEDTDACLAAVYEFLVAQYRHWTVVEFPMVTMDSAIYGWFCVKTAQGEDDPRVELVRASIAPYIPIEGHFDAYFGGFGKKQRYNVRSRRNRLYDEHQVRYASVEPSVESLNVLFDLHRRRATRKGIVSSFAQDRVFAFHRAFVERASPRGWVQFRLLEGPAGPIAAGYNLLLAGRVYSYQKGIDPAWERHGPGTVLLYELVREAFDSGCKEYNFLQGAESYKSEWTAHWRHLYTLRFYNRSLSGRLAAYRRSSQRFLKRLAYSRQG